ncbi:MAG: FAD-binding protein [Bacillota bacterium]
MKSWETDVLVVGGGLAGIRAAVEARRAGSAVLLVSLSPVGKANNSAISKGHFAIPGAGGPGDDFERHFQDIIAGGCRISDPGLVSAMIENLKDEVNFLLDCGVRLARRSDGSLVRSRPPGHSFPRVLSTTRGSGVEVLAPLAARAKEMGVRMVEGIEILSLLTGGEEVCGAWGCARSGEPVLIQAKAVILATGGAGSLYLRTNNAPGTAGLGQAMALSAGLSLVDMEFVQFYPTYLHMPGKPRVMIFYEVLVAVAGATLRNRYGEDIRKLYGMEDVSDLTRDRLSRAIASEIRAGRGVGADGEAVALDLSTLTDPEKYRRHLPRAVPPDAAAVNVAPVAHFTMGGVAVKPGGETEIPGLWAVGEVAGGIHGANRVGGNALAECLAMGRAAGSAAAAHALKPGRRQCPAREIKFPCGPGAGPENLSGLAEALRRILNNHAGVLRDAAGLAEGLAGINDLQDALKKSLGSDNSMVAFKLGMMLDVARAICLSALMRRESRGSHFRADYPAEREDCLGNFLVKKVDGELEIQFRPRQ